MSQLFINSTGGRQTKERDECSTEQPKISKSQTWIKLLAFSVHPMIKKDKEYWPLKMFHKAKKSTMPHPTQFKPSYEMCLIWRSGAFPLHVKGLYVIVPLFYWGKSIFSMLFKVVKIWKLNPNITDLLEELLLFYKNNL